MGERISAEGEPVDNGTWTFDPASGSLVIKSGMEDYSGYSKAPWVEQYSDSIITVTMEEGVSKIGKSAFEG